MVHLMPIINFFKNPDFYIGVVSAIIGGYVAFWIAKYQINVARKESEEAEIELRKERDQKIKHDYNLQKSSLLLSHKLEITKDFLNKSEHLIMDVLELYPIHLKLQDTRNEYESIESRDLQHSYNCEIGRIIQKLSTYKVDYASVSEMLGEIEVEVNPKEYPKGFKTGVINVCLYLNELMEIIESWNLKIPDDNKMIDVIQKIVNLIGVMDTAVRENYVSLLKTLEEDTAK